MRRFIEGADRDQSTLLPECLYDWVDVSNPFRAKTCRREAGALDSRPFVRTDALQHSTGKHTIDYVPQLAIIDMTTSIRLLDVKGNASHSSSLR